MSELPLEPRALRLTFCEVCGGSAWGRLGHRAARCTECGGHDELLVPRVQPREGRMPRLNALQRAERAFAEARQ